MQSLLCAIIGLLAGVILAKSLYTDSQSSNYATDDTKTAVAEIYTDEAVIASTDSALHELEQLLAEEREKNAVLANQIADLRTTVPTNTNQAPIREEREFTREEGAERGEERRASLPDVDELIEAGLSVYEANRALEIRQEAQDKLQALLEDPENRDRETLAAAREEFTEQMISELGIYGYENYLEATGLPTSVPVREVEPESAGAIAGIVEGDEIVSYDGERVFDIQSLRALTTDGEEGDTVSIEVLRDGNTVSLTVPTGTIGVTTERARTDLATRRTGRR